MNALSPVRLSLFVRLSLSKSGALGIKQNTMKSIIGKKIGMTSIFDTTGKQTAVTIIEAGPCVVTQKKTVETDGYNALQIAFGDKKEKHSIKSEVNHFAKAQTSPKKFVQEIRNSEIDKTLVKPSL
jgi:large subunit ribosomal protein L3